MSSAASSVSRMSVRSDLSDMSDNLMGESIGVSAGVPQDGQSVIPSSPITPARKTHVYGISYRDSPEVIFSPSIEDATRAIRQANISDKDVRFKKFMTEEEAINYFALNPILPTEQNIVEGYRSPFRSVPFRELSLFRNSISASVVKPELLADVFRRMDENPQFFIDLNKDLPVIVHTAFRFNAMHICCQYGNIVVAREIIQRVRDTVYLASVYGTDHNVRNASHNLLDKFLNTPDKVTNHSPVLIAARFGHYELVAFLTSFVECDIDFKNMPRKELFTLVCSKVNTKDNRLHHRIYDLLRHPMNVYCVTLYVEMENLEMPFISITTRFPPTSISSTDKMSSFMTKNCNGWSVNGVYGSVRISCDAFPFTPPPVTMPLHGVEELRPVCMMGVYSNRREACIAYRKITCYISSQDAVPFRCNPQRMRDYIVRAMCQEADSDGVAVFRPENSGMWPKESPMNPRKVIVGVEAVINSVANLNTSDQSAKDYTEWTKAMENEFTANAYTDVWYTPPTSPPPLPVCDDDGKEKKVYIPRASRKYTGSHI